MDGKERWAPLRASRALAPIAGKHQAPLATLLAHHVARLCPAGAPTSAALLIGTQLVMPRPQNYILCSVVHAHTSCERRQSMHARAQAPFVAEARPANGACAPSGAHVGRLMLIPQAAQLACLARPRRRALFRGAVLQVDRKLRVPLRPKSGLAWLRPRVRGRARASLLLRSRRRGCRAHARKRLPLFGIATMDASSQGAVMVGWSRALSPCVTPLRRACARPAVPVGTPEVLYCRFCPSAVLRPANAHLVAHEYRLPRLPGMRHASAGASASETSETLSAFWCVKDKFDFENVGFTKTVDGHLKYLICGECDMGPIGYYDLNDEASIYVACERVSSAPPEGAPSAAVDPALLSMVAQLREAEDAKQPEREQGAP